jgi:hypothetical protein
MEIIVAISVIALVIIIYVISYAINEKTPAPEGCEELTASAACHTCSNSLCSVKKIEEEIKSNVK